MGARGLSKVIAVAGLALLLTSEPGKAEEKKPVQAQPQINVTLRLDRTFQAESSKSKEPLAERSLPSLLLSPSQWKEAVKEFGEEAKPALLNYYWTGRSVTIERNNLYYSRSSLSYTKGIILKRLAHDRIDFGIYKSRLTLEQNRFYGMGPHFVSNPIPGVNTRVFRTPLFADMDRVFVMMRFHLGSLHH